MKIIHAILAATWAYIVANPVIVLTGLAALIGLGAACYRMQAARDAKTKAALEKLKVSVAAFADLQGVIQIDVISHSSSPLTLKADVVTDRSRWERFLRMFFRAETVLDSVQLLKKFDVSAPIPANGNLNISARISIADAEKFKSRWLWPLAVRMVAGNDPIVVPVKWHKVLAPAA
jgi:hypothetical protein